MGGSASRESEVSQRLIDAVEAGHAHTLSLLLKFVAHCDGGAPAQQIAAKNKGFVMGVLLASAQAPAAGAAGAGGASLLNVAGAGGVTREPADSEAEALANFKIRRVQPRAPPPALDEATAAFHARAAVLARAQAEASGEASASFPLAVDLNALRSYKSPSATTGDSLLVAAVKRDVAAIVQLLCEANADVNLRDDTVGWTALHHAAHLGRQTCLEVLLGEAGQALTLVHSLGGLRASQCAVDPTIRAMLVAREAEQEATLIQQVVSHSGGAYVGRALVFDESTPASFPLALYAVEVGTTAPGGAVVALDFSAPNVDVTIYFRGPAQRNEADCLCLYYVDDPVQAPHVQRARMGSVFYLSAKRSKPSVPPSRRAAANSTEPARSPASSPSSSSSSASASTASSAELSPAEIARLGWDSLTVSLPLATLPQGPKHGYRFLYFDSKRNQHVAASDVFSFQSVGNFGSREKPYGAASATSGTSSSSTNDEAAKDPSANAGYEPPAPKMPTPVSAPAASAASASAHAPPSLPAQAASSSIFSFLPAVLSPWSHRGGSGGTTVGASAVSAASSSSGATPSPHTAAPPTPSSSLPGGLGGVAAAAQSSQGPAPPVALHPSFLQLSAPTPERLAQFLKPPPPYFRSHFALNPSSVTLALALDPGLESFRARFVPLCMGESEFWIRYFFLMSKLEQEAEERERYQAPLIQPSPVHVSYGSAQSSAANSPVGSSPTATEGNQSPYASGSSGSFPPASSFAAHPSPAVAQAVGAAAAFAASSSVAASPRTPAAVVTTPAASAATSTPASPILPHTAPASAPGPRPVHAATSFSSAGGSSSSRRAVQSPEDDEGESSSYVPPSFAKLNTDATADVKGADVAAAESKWAQPDA